MHRIGGTPRVNQEVNEIRNDAGELVQALSLLVEHERAAEVSLGMLEAPQASMCEAAQREEVGFLGTVTRFVLE